jgi:hypothetical protein
MPEPHDRRTMERLHQHLARADIELRDAEHVLDPDSAEKSERDLAREVGAARRAVTSALEKVRSRLGVASPQSPPELQQRSWWRRMFGG